MELAVSTDGVLLRRQLAEAWAEIRALRRTVAHQARLLSNLSSETHPSAPSLNCIYWLYSETKYHSKSWRYEWNRLVPSLRGLGTILAPDLSPLVWERHRNARRREADRYGGLPCEHTLNIELARLKAILEWAVESRMIAFNPLRPAKYVKTKSERTTRLKQEDIERLLEESEDLRDRRLPEGDDDGLRAKKLQAFVLLCFDEMLRFNEARHVRRDLIEPNGDCQVTGKGNKTRVVTLTPRTLEAIRAIPPYQGTHYVFVNHSTGKLQGENTMRSWFRWACERGNLDSRAAPGDKRIVPHHLRHGGATEADEAGARPGAIQQTLGHDSMKTTQKYLHRETRESARHVAEKMVQAAESGRKPPRRAQRKK